MSSSATARWVEACALCTLPPSPASQTRKQERLDAVIAAFCEIFASPKSLSPEAVEGESLPKFPLPRAEQPPAEEPAAIEVPSARSPEIAAEAPAPKPPAHKAGPISIFGVDLKREKTGDFFTSLRFRRNDPAKDPVLQDLLEASLPTTGAVVTARQLFAYSIPWQERGGAPAEVAGDRPVFDALSAVSGFQKLGELATSHALKTASRMKRESRMMDSYTSSTDQEESAETFFRAVDWVVGRSSRSPQLI